MRLKAPFCLTLALATFASGLAAQGSGTVDVRKAMAQQVNPATLAIWDIGNNAMNDEGGIDPKLMDAAKWAKLSVAADQLSAAAASMSGATTIHAAGPDNLPPADAEGATIAEIQGYIDADADGFREEARGLADYAAKLAAAAKAKDAAKAGDEIAALDGVCESCHSRFWYPEQ